jgi:hypothetical protein
MGAVIELGARHDGFGAGHALASRLGGPGWIPNGSGPHYCVGQARFTSFF